jgi:pimeloyl-ACP methyl ester carboxylesterase
MAKTVNSPADYIVPLYMNGLSGRMLVLPDHKKTGRDILFIYGQHSSLERWWGLAQTLNDLGRVTMPDLPGLGGMTSLYKIGLDGSIDNLADYLAAFIKLRYKRQKVTIFGMSLGFVIVNRMLQRYPDLVDKVDNLVSVVGFLHHDDFVFSKKRHFFYRWASRLFSTKITAGLFRLLFLQPTYLRLFYAKSYNAREKFAELAGDEFKRTMDMEIHLWKINDVRTQMRTGYEMLSLDDTKIKVNLPIHHVASRKDRYFNNTSVEEHMRRVYKDFNVYFTKDPNHAPTIIADKSDAAAFVPPGLRRKLTKKKRRP